MDFIYIVDLGWFVVVVLEGYVFVEMVFGDLIGDLGVIVGVVCLVGV